MAEIKVEFDANLMTDEEWAELIGRIRYAVKYSDGVGSFEIHVEGWDE